MEWVFYEGSLLLNLKTTPRRYGFFNWNELYRLMIWWCSLSGIKSPTGNVQFRYYMFKFTFWYSMFQWHSRQNDGVTGNCHDLQTSAGEYCIVQSRAAEEGSLSAFQNRCSSQQWLEKFSSQYWRHICNCENVQRQMWLLITNFRSGIKGCSVWFNAREA